MSIIDGITAGAGLNGEEYGCGGVISEQLPVRSHIREHNGTKTHWVTFAYIVRVDPREVKINEPESMADIGWFTLDNLPQPLHTIAARQFHEWDAIFRRYA